MKTILHVLILFAGMSRQLASADTLDVEVFPLLEGTPLTSSGWLVSNTQKDQLGINQVWLTQADAQAVLIPPRQETTTQVIAPWGEEFFSEKDEVTLVLQSNRAKRWRFERFGGSIEVIGSRIELYYEANSTSSTQSNYYDLLDANKLIVGGQHHATLETDGKIVKIEGRLTLGDELYGPDENLIWHIHAGGNGSLKAQSWTQSITFNNMSTLIGSDFDDRFLLLDGVLNATIEGAGGKNEIIFDEKVSQQTKSQSMNSKCSRSILEDNQSCDNLGFRITFASEQMSTQNKPKKDNVERSSTASVRQSPPSTPTPILGFAAIIGVVFSFFTQSPILLSFFR